MEFFKHYLASQELQNTFKIKTFQNQNPSTLFLKNLPDPNTYFCNLYDPMFGFKKTEKLPISESINFYILENCILLNIIPVRQLTVDRDGIIKFINISANKSKNFIVDQAFSSFFASIENEINLSFKRILNTKIPEKINNTKLFFEGKLTRFMLTIFPIINEYEYILGFNIYMEETQQNAPLDGFANFDISVKRHQKSLFKCNSCERHFGIFKTKDLYCPFCQKNGILVNNSFFDFGIQFNELDSKSSSDLYEYLTDELIKLGLTHRDFERFIPKNLNFNLGTFKEGQNLQIIDFSQGGLKLKAAFDLKIGEVINFKLENKGETISIFLKILRKNNLVKEKSTIYAAKFLNYSQDDFKQINLFFDQLVDKNKQYNLNQKSSKLRNKFLMGSIISMVFLVGFSFFFIQEKIKDFVKFEYRKLKTIYYQKHHKTKINLDNLFQLAEVETSFVKTKVNKEKIKSPIKKEVNIWTLNAQEILDLENKKFDDFLNSFDSLNNYNLSVPWQRELHYLQFKYSKNKLTKLYFEIHFFIKNSDQEIQNKYKEKSQTVLGKISGKLKQIENIIIEHSSLIDSLKDQAFANYLGQIWRVTRENILK